MKKLMSAIGILVWMLALGISSPAKAYQYIPVARFSLTVAGNTGGCGGGYGGGCGGNYYPQPVNPCSTGGCGQVPYYPIAQPCQTGGCFPAPQYPQYPQYPPYGGGGYSQCGTHGCGPQYPPYGYQQYYRPFPTCQVGFFYTGGSCYRPRRVSAWGVSLRFGNFGIGFGGMTGGY